MAASTLSITWTPANLTDSIHQIVEYKLVTSTTWLTAGIVNNRADNYIITGIDRTKIYNIRIGNKCGSSTVYSPSIIVELDNSHDFKWIVDPLYSCCEYGNEELIVTAIKNNCDIGEEGSVVTYTVEENTYTSCSQFESDSLASEDAESNKQQYANDNGECVEIPPFYFSSNSAGNYVTSLMRVPYCSDSGCETISPGVKCCNVIRFHSTLPNNLNVTNMTSGNAIIRSWGNGSSGTILTIPETGQYRIYIRILGNMVVPNIGGDSWHVQQISFFLKKDSSYYNLIAPGQNSLFGESASAFCTAYNPIGMYNTQYVMQKNMTVPLDISFSEQTELTAGTQIGLEVRVWKSCAFNQQQGANEGHTTNFNFSALIIEIEKVE